MKNTLFTVALFTVFFVGGLNAQQQSGWLGRYWDGCKQTCSWSGSAGGIANACKECNIDNQLMTTSDQNRSSCEGGNSYACWDMIPFAVDDNLAFGFVAASNRSNQCGSCYELTFTGQGEYSTDDNHRAIQGKKMIVMVTNAGGDSNGNQFNLMVPGGGLGKMESFTRQTGISAQALGSLGQCWTGNAEAQRTCLRERCNLVFSAPAHDTLKRGCVFYADWLMAADAPRYISTPVVCPRLLREIYSGGHIITFNANGGTVSPASAISPINGTLSNLPTPTKSGYNFSGWFTEETGGTEVTADHVFNASAAIFARWTPMLNSASVSTDFDPWDRSVTLSFRYSYSQNTEASFYVYRRIGSAAWELLNPDGIPVTMGANNLLVSYTDGTIDFRRTYEYRIIFSEGPPAADTDLRADISVSTTPAMGTWSVNAVGNDNNIEVMLGGIDSRFTNSTNFGYTIDRSFNGGAFTSWISTPQRFDGATTYTQIDTEPNLPCNRYQYRVYVSAFDTTFIETSPTVSIAGNTRFSQPLRASKGEHADHVRLEWRVNKLSASNDETYRIWRRTANSGNEFTELETVTSSAAVVYFSDNNILTGIYYDYRVTLYQVCSSEEIELASVNDIGFTQAFGTVSGSITYGTNNPLPNVNVFVRRSGLNDGENPHRSLHSRGGGQTFDFSSISGIAEDNNWTLQFWLRPGVTNIGENIRIGTLGGVNLLMSAVNSGYQIHTSVNSNAAARSAVIPADHWSHITLIRDSNDWVFHTVLDQTAVLGQNFDEIQFAVNAFSATGATSGTFDFGRDLRGNIDDVRFWNRVLDTVEIRRDYSRRLTGSENGLRGLWTFDEGLTGYAFDMSRVGTVYNGNHAISNTLEPSAMVPDETQQLALKGVTDASGNYQINGIPYYGGGTGYSIVPLSGALQFNPAERLLNISHATTVNNGVNFTTSLVTRLTVSPTDTELIRDTTVTFTAEVFPVSGVTLSPQDRAVEWSVNGAKSIGTAITTGGVLTVALGETADTLIVRAVSVRDETKFDEAIVRVRTISITETNVTFSDTYIYSGDSIKPIPIVVRGISDTLRAGVDFSAAFYEYNVNVSDTARITIRGNDSTGRYYGDTTIYFPIIRNTPMRDDLSFTMPTHVYNGRSQGIDPSDITLKGDMSGLGAVSVFYNNLSALPVDAGTYSVLVEDSGW